MVAGRHDNPAAFESGQSADIFASWPPAGDNENELSLGANVAIAQSLDDAAAAAAAAAMLPPSRAASALSTRSIARLERLYDADAISENGENLDPIASLTASAAASSKRSSSTMSAEAQRRIERSVHILHEKIRMKIAQHGEQAVRKNEYIFLQSKNSSLLSSRLHSTTSLTGQWRRSALFSRKASDARKRKRRPQPNFTRFLNFAKLAPLKRGKISRTTRSQFACRQNANSNFHQTNRSATFFI